MNSPLGRSGISVLDTNNLNQNDLLKIYEVEKDMWAREDGIGEYVQCQNCDTVLSKEDVFGSLEKDILSETVTKIEEILSIDSIKCTNCSSTNTIFLFGDDYINEIIDRFKNSESYLVVYKDTNGIIRGFVDGYIENFKVIYKREFENYYSHIGEKRIVELIEEVIGMGIPNEMFYCSAIGIETKYKNFRIIIKLLKELFNSINDGGREIKGVSEMRIGSSIDSLTGLFGSKPIGINNQFIDSDNKKHNPDIKSEIYITDNMVQTYRESLSGSMKDLIIKIKGNLNSLKI